MIKRYACHTIPITFLENPKISKKSWFFKIFIFFVISGISSGAGWRVVEAPPSCCASPLALPRRRKRTRPKYDRFHRFQHAPSVQTASGNSFREFRFPVEIYDFMIIIMILWNIMNSQEFLFFRDFVILRSGGYSSSCYAHVGSWRTITNHSNSTQARRVRPERPATLWYLARLD